MIKILANVIKKHKIALKEKESNVQKYASRLVNCFEKEIEKFYKDPRNEYNLIDHIRLNNNFVVIEFKQVVYRPDDRFVSNDAKLLLDCFRIKNRSISIISEVVKQLENRGYKNVNINTNEQNLYHNIDFEIE